MKYLYITSIFCMITFFLSMYSTDQGYPRFFVRSFSVVDDALKKQAFLGACAGLSAGLMIMPLAYCTTHDCINLSNPTNMFYVSWAAISLGTTVNAVCQIKKIHNRMKERFVCGDV